MSEWIAAEFALAALNFVSAAQPGWRWRRRLNFGVACVCAGLGFAALLLGGAR